MTSGKLKIAVVGAGLGGTTLAAMLLRAGFDVTVYEQSPALTALGAGIHLGPNLVKVLRHLGVETPLYAFCNRPDSWRSRDVRTGEMLFRLPFDQAEALYGAPYLTVHRGLFHEVLAGTVPAANIQLNKRLAAIQDKAGLPLLCFADGSQAVADIVVGADGINSRVREHILGSERPTYTGVVAYRAEYPSSLLDGLKVDDLTKWWGDHRSVMCYFMSHWRESIYFVADVPEAEWPHEKSFVEGDVGQMRAAFADAHPDLRKIVEAAPAATKWAIMERNPSPLWSVGRIVLLGDACHPMRPHMGQGAAMAIEDGAILARCLIASDPGDYVSAFRRYEATRRDRASAVQAESSRNRWLRQEMDASWVYGYDAIHDPLAP